MVCIQGTQLACGSWCALTAPFGAEVRPTRVCNKLFRRQILIARKQKIIRAPTRRINNEKQLLLRGARMQLKPFLLDAWLDQYEHGIEFNLAASTGPTWTVNDILALADDETRHRFLNHKLAYGRPAGTDSLREAIAEMQHVPVEAVQIVTGASEALVALMWLAAEPGANVILPLPGFTT